MPKKTDPQGKPDKAFEAELARRPRERVTCWPGRPRCCRSSRTHAQILATLAGLPSDWQQWQLASAGPDRGRRARHRKAGVLFGLRMDGAWRAGEDFIDKPLALIGQAVELRLAQLDVGVLGQMKAFGTPR